MQENFVKKQCERLKSMNLIIERAVNDVISMVCAYDLSVTNTPGKPNRRCRKRIHRRC